VPALAGASSWRSSATSERLTVARVLGAKGLAGGLRVEVLTDWPDRLAAGSRVWLDGEQDAREIESAEWGGRHPVIQLEGIADREAAAALAGRFLEAMPRALPADTYYWHQLVGLRVRDAAGKELGTLTEVFRAGGAEVYRIEGEEGEVLVPALRSVVREIDLGAGTMAVDYRPEEV